MDTRSCSRQDSFRSCFEESSGFVRSYLLRRGAGQLTDDLAAEVFAIAWQRWDDVPEPPLPWLLRTARNCLSNARRSDQRRASLIESLPLPSSVDQTHEAALSAAATAALFAALEQLSVLDRELLLLVAWDGLSPSEAADVMNCSASTARVRLHRARRRLATRLELSPVSDQTLEVIECLN